jgi:hypothetical protein
MLVMNPSDLAKQLGQRGGRARAARLSPAQKRQIAATGGRARRASLEAARRILENFRYLAAIDGLRGDRPPVKRLRSCSGRLPDISRTRPTP